MQHVREPYNLGDSDYGEFSLDLEEFLGDDRSLPYRPAHLVADIASKGLAFRQKLDAMNTALATRKTASNTIKNCVGEIDRLVRWMRNILPTLSDDSILLPFGLDRKVPDGYAELKDYADTVDAHWQTVKLEPLFAPVAVRMDDLAGLIATYETARALQITADGEYDQLQNEKDIARGEFHEAERLVFNWFAAHYPDGQDMYWEQTPWGKASGSGGGEPEPEPSPGELPQLPEAPEGLKVVIWWEPSLMLLISVGPYGEHTGFDLCKAETPMGMMEPPDRPDENLVSNLPLDVEPFGDDEVVPGMKYWYWARARNGGDVGNWTEPFGVDVE